jgi:glycosyltransferase involved in cell wall biosynthesis
VKILIAHNRYQQAGGEDAVVRAEAAMLERRGHTVDMLEFDNDAIHGAPAKLIAGLNTFYSRTSYSRVERVIQRFRPQILHVHNFLPVLSPSVFFAARHNHVPAIQTLHNYRLLCASATMYRDGHVCEECLERRSIIPGIKYGCYRESRLGSAVVGGTVALHNALGTWKGRIDRYIALTDFAARKLGTWRVPGEKVRVKPNFVQDLGAGSGGGNYALFVGRLSKEKGLDVLIAADIAGVLPLPVYIAGSGQMFSDVEAAAARFGSRLVLLGKQSAESIRTLMREATVLLVPSVWYEGFPMVIVEALSAGLPVLCSRIGGLAESIEDGACGMLFEAGNVDNFATVFRTFTSMPSNELQAMRDCSRARFQSLYSEDINYETLLRIYREVLPSASLY